MVYIEVWNGQKHTVLEMYPEEVGDFLLDAPYKYTRLKVRWGNYYPRHLDMGALITHNPAPLISEITFN